MRQCFSCFHAGAVTRPLGVPSPPPRGGAILNGPKEPAGRGRAERHCHRVCPVRAPADSYPRAKSNGLDHLYDAEIGRAIGASSKNWPSRRKAGMIHLTAMLLDIGEKTIRRRLAKCLRQGGARNCSARWCGGMVHGSY